MLDRSLLFMTIPSYLSNAGVCTFESRPNTLWWLVGIFNGGLKEINWKSLMNFSGQPSPVRIVDGFCVCQL